MERFISENYIPISSQYIRDEVLRIRTQGIGRIRKGTAKNEKRNHRVRRNGSRI